MRGPRTKTHFIFVRVLRARFFPSRMFHVARGLFSAALASVSIIGTAFIYFRTRHRVAYASPKVPVETPLLRADSRPLAPRLVSPAPQKLECLPQYATLVRELEAISRRVAEIQASSRATGQVSSEHAEELVRLRAKEASIELELPSKKDCRSEHDRAAHPPRFIFELEDILKNLRRREKPSDETLRQITAVSRELAALEELEPNKPVWFRLAYRESAFAAAKPQPWRRTMFRFKRCMIVLTALSPLIRGVG